MGIIGSVCLFVFLTNKGGGRQSIVCIRGRVVIEHRMNDFTRERKQLNVWCHG